MKHKEYLERQRRNPEYMAVQKELQPILDVANDVLRLRLQKGWSQAELAEHVGTKQANISRLENGLANPSIELLQRLAKALGTELLVRLGAKEEAEHTKLIFVYEIRQDVPAPTEAKYSIEDLPLNGYGASLTDYVLDTSTQPERVRL